MKGVIVTGDRPTGRLHLGHYIGSLMNRVRLQDEYEQYIMIADIQALTDNADNPLKVRNNILEVALDYLAVGIDPHKSTIFIQSLIPELGELTLYFMNLITLSQLQNNPTVKDEMKQKGFGNSIPVGFLTYPISQVADILAFKANTLPVGGDQLPMVELTNDIVRKFNRTYAPVFQEITPILSAFPRLKGLDGNQKMGKSLNNAIFLSDTYSEIRSKVFSAYTDPAHIKASDPGNVEGNMIFYYLDAFDPDTETVAMLKKQYEQGGLGDVELKERLTEVLEKIIRPIRERREQLAAEPETILQLLEEHSERCKAITRQTLADVKHAMTIDYFNRTHN